MSRSSERLGLLVTVCALVLVVGSAQAQQQGANTASIRALQDSKAKPGVPKDASVSSSVPRSTKRPLMRCWQDGKLIYEGGGMTVPAAAASASIELRNGNTLALQIFDLKSGMCLLDHSTD